MLNLSSNMTQRLFFILYIGSILFMMPILGVPNLRHLLFPALTIGIVICAECFFCSKNKYYTALVIMLGFYISCFWVAIHGNTQEIFKIKDYIIYESFDTTVAIFVLVLSHISHNTKYQFFMSMILILITTIPVLLIWSYYLSTHAFLSVESCMAILQSNPSEAWQYINDYIGATSLISVVVVLGGGAYVFFISQRCKMKPLSRKSYALLCLLLILDVAMIYRTRTNIIGNLIYDTHVYAKQYENFQKNREQRIRNLATLPTLSEQGKNGVYILVIGESETRDRMGIYGYDRNTTPELDSMKKQDKIVVFNKAWSCANDTVSALTYALTNKNQYNDVSLENAFSLVEVANAAGYNTVWISNQAQYGLADTPITSIASEAIQQIWLRDKVGHLKDGRYLDIPGYYDEEVIPSLDEIEYSDKMLIIIHLIGSHNSYKLRYPENFSKYSGDDSDEYDNTILYTDSVLSRIIDKTRSIPNFQGLVYFSDHGEGIDEHVGHDSNKFNYQMTRIPMIMYMSNSFKENRHRDYLNLSRKCNEYFTNDLIFDAVLGIMGIKGENISNDSDDIISPQYNGNINRFYTSYGKRKIADDSSIDEIY